MFPIECEAVQVKNKINQLHDLSCWRYAGGALVEKLPASIHSLFFLLLCCVIIVMLPLLGRCFLAGRRQPRLLSRKARTETGEQRCASQGSGGGRAFCKTVASRDAQAKVAAEAELPAKLVLWARTMVYQGSHRRGSHWSLAPPVGNVKRAEPVVTRSVRAQVTAG